MSYQEIYNLTYPVILLLLIAGSYAFAINIEFINRSLNRNEPLVERGIYVMSVVIVIAFIGLAFYYVYFPGYWDHAEASIVSLGIIFKNGGQLYPTLDTYTFNGILYGPFLSELHSLFQFGDLTPIFASKLPGFFAFLLSTIILFILFKNFTSRIYLLLLLIFGVLNFWTRTEPILNLIVALSLLILVKYKSSNIYLILGLLGAIAFSIKFHAVLYVVSAIIVTSNKLIINKERLLFFALGGIVGVFVIFTPPQITILNYVNYLHQAAKHGISLVSLLGNFGFFILINIPFIFYLCNKGNHKDDYHLRIAFLLAIEALTCIIGSKPGAGIHHLMPYIPLNAFVLNQLIENNVLTRNQIKYITHFVMLVMLTIIAPKTLETFKSFKKNQQYFLNISAELTELSLKYNNLVLGATDHDHYDLTFFRPILESRVVRQIDYSAFMDYKLSQVDDKRLAKAMDQCEIPMLAMPNSGEAFSIRSYYDGKLLFSDEVRTTFERSYKILKKYNYFTIYKCNQNL